MRRENEDCDVLQVHTVLARDPAPNDGLLELALRPLSIPAPFSAPGTSTSVGGKERKLSSGLAAKDGESERVDEKNERSKGERKLSFGAKFIAEAARRASLSTPSTSASTATKPHSATQEPRLSQTASISPLSLEGYEAAARTATGEVYAWNMRWPNLSNPTDLEAECGVILLPPMTAQLVSLPPGERDSTLFPVSVGVRCAVCVTVGESEDSGTIKEKVKRAWKGKGRVTMMRFDGTTVL